MVPGHPFNPLDHDLLVFFNRPGWPPLDALMQAASNRALLLPILIAIAVIIAFRSPHRWPAAVMLIVATGAADLAAVRLVKPMVARVRPCRADPAEVRAPLGCGSGQSFPSSHASTAAAAAVIVSWATPAGSAFAILAAALIGASRVYLGVHWPTDVLGGWLLGATISFVLLTIWRLRYAVDRRD